VKNVDGTRVKEQREMHNWSQQELAEHAGVSLHTVFRAEKGTNIQSKNLEALAVALHTSVAYLMGETNDCRPLNTRNTIPNAIDIKKATEPAFDDSPLQAEIIKAVRETKDPDKLRKMLEYASDKKRLEDLERIKGA
jgi:transcriptional regulator with XRE-family HTH domain